MSAFDPKRTSAADQAVTPDRRRSDRRPGMSKVEPCELAPCLCPNSAS